MSWLRNTRNGYFRSLFSAFQRYVIFSYIGRYMKPGLEFNFFSCSTQLSTIFILLINVKMPTIVGILTFISMINTASVDLKQYTSLFYGSLVFMSS